MALTSSFDCADHIDFGRHAFELHVPARCHRTREEDYFAGLPTLVKIFFQWWMGASFWFFIRTQEMEEVEKVEDEVVFDNLHYTGNIFPTGYKVLFFYFQENLLCKNSPRQFIHTVLNYLIFQLTRPAHWVAPSLVRRTTSRTWPATTLWTTSRFAKSTLMARTG